MSPAERARHASLVRWGKEQPFAARLEAVRERRKAAKQKKAKGRGKAKTKLTPAEKEAERAKQMVANVENVGDALNQSDNPMLSKNGLAGLVSAANGEEPPSNVAQGLIDSGLAVRGEDGRYRLTADGQAIVRAAESGDTNAVLDRLSAVNDKNVAAAEKEKAKAEKEAKPKGGGGGGGSKKETEEEKAKKKEEERNQTRVTTAEKVGLRPAEASALLSVAEGGEVDEADVDNLAELGLVAATSDGQFEATDAGRRALAALEKGDVRAYRAAIQDAKTKQERTQAREAARKQRQADRRAREDERRAREDERRRKEDGGEEEASNPDKGNTADDRLRGRGGQRKPGREKRGPTRPPVSTMPTTKALDVDGVYRRYHETVNMSASELAAWAETDTSRRASLDRAPIRRNLRLLRKPKAEWTAADIRDANRTISFVSRMRGAEQGKPVNKDIPYSKRDISLRNWAYDPDGKKASDMDIVPLLDDLKALRDEVRDLAEEDDAEVKAGRRNSIMDQSLIDEGYAMAEELCDLFEALGATVEDEDEDGEMDDMPDGEMMDDMEGKSIDYEREAQRVREAWYRKVTPQGAMAVPTGEPTELPHCVSVYDDAIIICHQAHFWRVPYEDGGDGIAFAERSEWEEVQPGYVAMKAQRTFGGKDREDVPDESFAGPNRTFPIMTAQDVRDAARLIGKADDPEAVKKRIIAIAKRKGFADAIPEGWEVKKSADEEDISVVLGAEVKSIGGDQVRGLAIRFGNADEPDMSHMRDFFSRDTAYWLDAWKTRPMLYHHAMEPNTADNPIVGTWTKATVTDEGVWLEGELSKSFKYHAAIKEMVRRGLLHISTDSAPHLVVRDRMQNGTNAVKRWPICAASLTIAPAEPRLASVAFKSLIDELGLPLEDQMSEAKDGDRSRRLLLELELLELEATQSGVVSG